MAKSFLPTIFEHPYEIDPKYGKSVAYFSMEYAIDNSFKIYSGGLGYLSGSHMRSAHDLRQNLVGVGILELRLLQPDPCGGRIHGHAIHA